MEKLIADHLIAVPVIAAATAAIGTNVDRLILFSLRFFSAATLKAEVDKLDALVKARIDKDAGQASKTP